MEVSLESHSNNNNNYNEKVCGADLDEVVVLVENHVQEVGVELFSGGTLAWIMEEESSTLNYHNNNNNKVNNNNNNKDNKDNKDTNKSSSSTVEW